jgi:FdhD protein
VTESTGNTQNEVGIIRWAAGATEGVRDSVAAEEPLEIRVRGRPISVVMRTPGHDDELAAGFLLTEGIVRAASDILGIEPCPRSEPGNVVNVRLAPMVHVDFERLSRHVFASSSCGLCGKATIEAVRGQFPPVESGVRVCASVIAGMPVRLRESQATFARTGGLHGAGLFDERGELLIAREDIGRHNAVDKVIGHALLRGWTGMERTVLMVSGRASFEIMQKAAAARVAVVAAVSAPSSLAVSFAEEMNQTLLGFVREGRLNAYAHPERIDFSCESAGISP